MVVYSWFTNFSTGFFSIVIYVILPKGTNNEALNASWLQRGFKEIDGRPCKLKLHWCPDRLLPLRLTGSGMEMVLWAKPEWNFATAVNASRFFLGGLTFDVFFCRSHIWAMTHPMRILSNSNSSYFTSSSGSLEQNFVRSETKKLAPELIWLVVWLLFSIFPYIGNV